MTSAKVINSSGKRKSAIARAVTKAGKGRVRINSIPLEVYEPEFARLKIVEPLKIAGKKAGKIDISVNVKGGGVMGQADAVRIAIAKGIVEYFGDKELREFLLKYDRSILVNDPRRREAKHQLGRGARAKRQKSYR